MKKKIGILSVLLVCAVILVGVLFVQRHRITESRNDNSIEENKEKDDVQETISKEGLTGEELAWASYNDIRNSIVKIDMGEYSGSGVVMDITDTEILLVSSGHLLQHFESGAVRFSNGAVSVGWVKGISEAYDVGFMVVKTGDIEAEKLKMLKPVQYDEQFFEQITVGTEIFQVGSTSGVGADFYMGSILSKEWYLDEFESYMLYNFCKATPGMSGGGCFTYDGYFIGLISGSYLEESCALPLPLILEAKAELIEDK